MEELEEMATPAFKLRKDIVGRMLSQDPALYTDIEIENPFSAEISQKYLETVKEVAELIKNEDSEALEKLISEIKEKFGEKSEESLKRTQARLC